MDIVNTGTTTTTIDNKKINEITWDAQYDGKIANIHLDVSSPGQKEHVTMKLTNEDIMRLLDKPTINQSLDKLLINDFSLQSKTKMKTKQSNKKPKRGGKSKSKSKSKRNVTKKIRRQRRR